MRTETSRKTDRALILISGLLLLMLAFAPNSHAAQGSNNGNGNGNGKGKGHVDSGATGAATEGDSASDDAAAADSGEAAAEDTGAAADASDATATSGPGNSGQGCDGTHHSDTGHGANQGGPYDNTCDGSPSGNGNGGGNATGKPCAGCVGNADDKNPHGQMPNGSDANRGYECDSNHGIGRTNPAHTGCRQADPEECPAGMHLKDGECVEDEGDADSCPDGSMPVNGVCASDDDSCLPGQVLTNGLCIDELPECPAGTVLVSTGACVSVSGEEYAPAAVLAAHAAPTSVAAATGRLPFTGLALWMVALLGIAAIALGLVARSIPSRAGRRNSRAGA